MGRRAAHRAPADVASAWHVDCGGGFDAMKATFGTHAFPPHAHETYVVEAGVDEFQCGAAVWRAAAHDIVLIGPGEVHTGRPSHGPLSYRSLYPRGGLLADVVEQLHGRRWEPRFRSPVVTDRPLARRIASLHRTLERPVEALAAETRLLMVLAQLIRRHALPCAEPRPVHSEPAAVRRALTLLHDPECPSTSLQALSAAAGLSPYHFLRVFKRETGLPPHQYHLNVRLERGRRFLRDGCDIAEAAVRAGFADQSHFTRAFRRFFGVTPGRYATARSFKTAARDVVGNTRARL